MIGGTRLAVLVAASLGLNCLTGCATPHLHKTATQAHTTSSTILAMNRTLRPSPVPSTSARKTPPGEAGPCKGVTERPPQAVTLKPGSRAYVGVAKPACVLGDQTLATTITMLLPGLHKVVSASLTGRALTLDYCRGGPHVPENTVAISPIEAVANHTQY